jgi:hypothetical protein
MNWLKSALLSAIEMVHMVIACNSLAALSGNIVKPSDIGENLHDRN